MRPLETQAEQEIEDSRHNEVSWIRMGHRPKWFTQIQRGMWLIDCTRTGKSRREVGSPARLIRKRRYTTKAGKTYHMLMLERPKEREEMSLTEFSIRWRRVAPRGQPPPRRSQAISNETLAAKVLQFWNPRGKIRSRP